MYRSLREREHILYKTHSLVDVEHVSLFLRDASFPVCLHVFEIERMRSLWSLLSVVHVSLLFLDMFLFVYPRISTPTSTSSHFSFRGSSCLYLHRRHVWLVKSDERERILTFDSSKVTKENVFSLLTRQKWQKRTHSHVWRVKSDVWTRLVYKI